MYVNFKIHSERSLCKWIDISMSTTGFVKVSSHHVYLNWCDCEYQHHFENIHPSLCSSCIASYYINKVNTHKILLSHTHIFKWLLTLVINLLCLDFNGNVHLHLFKSKLKCFDLLTDFFYCANCCLFIIVLTMLKNDKIDFFRFSVQLLPANAHISFVLKSEFHIPVCFIFNPFNFLVSLSNLLHKEISRV